MIVPSREKKEEQNVEKIFICEENGKPTFSLLLLIISVCTQTITTQQTQEQNKKKISPERERGGSLAGCSRTL